jgi:divalent metal cation (Fe/Co/Zn/Cd) transporter
MLTGVTAKPEFLSKITWICLNHSPEITKIETVRAFHFGSRFLVEVDIVLPKNMTLDHTHEIGESLQQKLEGLRDVERAFVHVDWETDHRPETEHRMP